MKRVPLDKQPKRASDPADPPGSLLVLSLLSLLVGAAAGLIGVAFRLTLDQADNFRNALLTHAHGTPLLGFTGVVAICALATAVAAWLGRRFSPIASGSGIPHVEAVLNEELPPAPPQLILVKFLGGLLAIGSGLALGREGPSVQMGAGVAHLLGKAFRRDWPDCRVLMAAGAGAGLATAFNSPIAGAVFVLEELVRRFETRIAIAALGASATAISVARAFLGDGPDFQVEPLNFAGPEARLLYFALGIVAGLVAIVYNRTLMGAIAVADRLGDWPVELRAAIIGAGVGVAAWFAPEFVGGGEAITQNMLTAPASLSLISIAFVLRFGLGPVSYAAKTPGGLFAPMLPLRKHQAAYSPLCFCWEPNSVFSAGHSAALNFPI